MERKYRETVLRRLRWRRRILTAALCTFLISAAGRILPAGIKSRFLAGITDFAVPAVFSYADREERVRAPFWVELTVPSVFAYTWSAEQDTAGLFANSDKNMDSGTEEAVPEQAEKEEQEPAVSDKKTEDRELSVLIENLYQGEGADKPAAAGSLSEDPADSLLTDSPVKRQVFDLTKYTGLEDLISQFYIVDASTKADSSLINKEDLMSFDCTIDKNIEGPQILIYHSHSQEAFADSVEGDISTTIVGAGARLARLLEEEYGYRVLHHTGTYDVPSRDDAYSKALPAIEQLLEENPSIQVVIDLHRDAVAEGTKLVTAIDGKNYARFMFFNGLCRTASGPISYLYNPYLKENLSFSFQAQLIAESYFPGVTRKIYLKAWRYNMHFRQRNMLIELGAQTNTVEEIMNTCDILAFVLDGVLGGSLQE